MHSCTRLGPSDTPFRHSVQGGAFTAVASVDFDAHRGNGKESMYPQVYGPAYPLIHPRTTQLPALVPYHNVPYRQLFTRTAVSHLLQAPSRS